MAGLGAAFTHRLQLIWGPLGTCKSRTLRAEQHGTLLDAARSGKPVRVLLGAATYTAIDTVLLPVIAELEQMLPAVRCGGVARLRSYLARRELQVPDEVDVVLNAAIPSERVKELRAALFGRGRTLLVAATPQQVHNLLRINDGPARGELFDLILIDEASQLDIAKAILALAALAGGGSVILAGDPLQLPPIHPAKPPLGLEALVGSVGSY